MLKDIVAERIAGTITELARAYAADLAAALGSSLGKPQAAPPIKSTVVDVVRYAQAGNAKLSNDGVVGRINSLLLFLSATCYPPTSTLAEALWQRRAGEPETDIEVVLLAARARWC